MKSCTKYLKYFLGIVYVLFWNQIWVRMVVSDPNFHIRICIYANNNTEKIKIHRIHNNHYILHTRQDVQVQFKIFKIQNPFEHTWTIGSMMDCEKPSLSTYCFLTSSPSLADIAAEYSGTDSTLS